MKTHHTPPPRRTQQGLSLIELMVAVAISLLMMSSFIVSLLNMKTTFVTQDALAQLQDNERLAVTILTNTVHAAGYVADPKNNLASDIFVANTGYGTYGSFGAQQYLSGTAGSVGNPESFSVRFMWTNGIIDCTGQTSTTGALRINTFTINAANELVCSTDGGATWLPIISNVSAMNVLYGVATGGGSNVTRYVASGDMSAALWPNVKTMRITLQMMNPFANAATFDSVQTISLLNQL
jgi:type IV pilus assembly protein PilW